MKRFSHIEIITAIVVMALMVSPTMVLALSDPTVIEEYNAERHRLEYTVVNPIDSSIGDVVGFVVEVDYSYSLYVDAENGWNRQGMDNPITDWDSYMNGSTYMTWREFFGGIDYPFGDSHAAAYYVPYNEVSPGTFQFEYLYEPPSGNHLPILPGESLSEFYAYVDGPASQYVLAHTGDAENDTFGSSGLPYFQGEAIPEPATILLLGLGGLVFRKRR